MFIHALALSINPSPIEIGKIGMSVCYDIRFPHMYAQLAARGAEIVFVPSGMLVSKCVHYSSCDCAHVVSRFSGHENHFVRCQLRVDVYVGICGRGGYMPRKYKHRERETKTKKEEENNKKQLKNARTMCAFSYFYLYACPCVTVLVRVACTCVGVQLLVCLWCVRVFCFCFFCFFIELKLLDARCLFLSSHVRIAHSAFTVPTGAAHWITLMQARAIENQFCKFNHFPLGANWTNFLGKRKAKRPIDFVRCLVSHGNLKGAKGPISQYERDNLPYLNLDVSVYMHFSYVIN